jgi:putative oxidoreductase
MTWFKRVRLVVAWLLGLYFANMYVRNGWAKFDPNGFWTPAFVRWGYPVWMRVAVGAIELVGGALLLVPWVASYAALAVMAVMLGALGTRLHDGRMVDSAWIAAYAIGLLWIAIEWWSFRARRKLSIEETQVIPA